MDLSSVMPTPRFVGWTLDEVRAIARKVGRVEPLVRLALADVSVATPSDGVRTTISDLQVLGVPDK